MRTIILFLIVSLFNCSSSQETIVSNKTFNDVFSSNEIRDIEIVFNFFNNKICDEYGGSNLDTCYKKFLYKISRQIPDGNIDFNIPYESQKEMYNQLDSSSFNTLWEFNMLWHTKERKDTMRYMTFKHDGRFIKLLEQVGKENKAVNYYYESFIAAGDISPSIGSGILMNYEYYDIEDIRVKFLIAMHCLTLNDQWNRKEKY